MALPCFFNCLTTMERVGYLIALISILISQGQFVAPLFKCQPFARFLVADSFVRLFTQSTVHAFTFGLVLQFSGAFIQTRTHCAFMRFMTHWRATFDFFTAANVCPTAPQRHRVDPMLLTNC